MTVPRMPNPKTHLWRLLSKKQLMARVHKGHHSSGCGRPCVLTQGLHGMHGVREDEPESELSDTDRFVGEVKGHVLTDKLQRSRGRAEVRGTGTPGHLSIAGSQTKGRERRGVARLQRSFLVKIGVAY